MRAGVREHEGLGEELEVGQAAGRELHVPRLVVALLPRDQLAHRADLAGDLRPDRAARRRSRRSRRDASSQKASVAGERAGAGQRHVLPELGLVALIGDEAGETAWRRGPLPPCGRRRRSTS